MATAKERSDEREKARAARQAERNSVASDVGPTTQAQQQGDGQPENARELEDETSGSARASTIQED